MEDLILDAVPLGAAPSPSPSPAPVIVRSPTQELPKPGRQVYNITGSQSVHIGPVIHNISMSQKPKPRLQERILKRDVDALIMCHRMIGDRDKYVTSEHLGDSWKSLGRVMGFSEGQLQNIEVDNSRNADRVFEILSLWHDRESDRATVSKLTQMVIDVKAYHLLKYLRP
ncbi:hypothetical protein SK128_007658 [Halocaridina rubra]|uniref:Death domain-containing protein n=1 Tax=Halocaridina rubra TaxID=373956 RepID=A0AAN8ZVH9_HALRR